MTQEIYNPNPGFSNPHIKDFDEYLSLYKESIENPEKFFGDLAKENISWIEDFKEVHNSEFTTFGGNEEFLRQHGVEVVIAEDADCIALMEKFIREKPELWAEDIAED